MAKILNLSFFFCHQILTFVNRLAKNTFTFRIDPTFTGTLPFPLSIHIPLPKSAYSLFSIANKNFQFSYDSEHGCKRHQFSFKLRLLFKPFFCCCNGPSDFGKAVVSQLVLGVHKPPPFTFHSTQLVTSTFRLLFLALPVSPSLHIRTSQRFQCRFSLFLFQVTSWTSAAKKYLCVLHHPYFILSLYSPQVEPWKVAPS